MLNADDPLCLAMAPGLLARRLILFAPTGLNEASETHRQAGGTVVTVMDDTIVRFEGRRSHAVALVSDLPAAFGGLATHNTANATCAAALAVGLNFGDAVIAEGLRSFTTDQAHGSYRLTFVEGFPFRLLVDYAHNAEQVRVLVKFADRLETNGKRIVMLNIAGNRSDEQTAELARAAAGHFDHYICFDVPKYRRGRPPGKIAELLRNALLAEGIPFETTSAHAEIEDAVEEVARMAGSNDLVVSQGTRYLLPFFRQITGQGPPEERYPTYLL